MASAVSSDNATASVQRNCGSKLAPQSAGRTFVPLISRRHSAEVFSVNPIPHRLRADFAKRPIADAVVCGDALKLIPTLRDGSVSLFLTSPPYAMQRKRQYGGVAEKDYPDWMCRVMAALRPKLTDDGSIVVVIRSHLKDGVVSDYVLRTRLALREDGWKENEELIWYKPDAAFFGSKLRLRRNFENILWFSRVNNPYIHLTATGNFSDRIGFKGSHRFRNYNNPIATKRSSKLMIGQARGSDVFVAPVSDVEQGVMHPAMFPTTLCEKLIRTFSRRGDIVCDPFVGSGTVLLAAQSLDRKIVGFDVNQKYVEIAKERLARESFKRHGYTPDVPSLQKVVRLRSDFPQRSRLRRAFLMEKGFTESDVRVFGFVLDRTVQSPEHKESAHLSVNRIVADCGLSRSTVIRSIKKLSDGNLIEVSKDAQWNRHRASEIKISPSITEVVAGQTSVITFRRGTSFGKPSFREDERKLRRNAG